MAKYHFPSAAPVIALFAKIEGKIIFEPKLALDTGATYCMIPWEIAETLGIRPELSKETVNIITASGVEKSPLVILKTVEALGKKVTNVKAVVHDLPPQSYVDGLLGLSFLRHFKISIDFQNGILEIL